MIQCSFEETIDLSDGGSRHTKCINEAKILVVADSCYGLCYSCGYQKLKAENKMLKKVPRCPCNGILEGVGYDIKTKDVIFECVKCKTQLILPDKIWQLILEG